MTWRKALFGAIGSILLGIIGSAVWELLVRPAIPRLPRIGAAVRDAVLNIPTLGTNFVKDAIYSQIPGVMHEQMTPDQPIALLVLLSLLALLGLASWLVENPPRWEQAERLREAMASWTAEDRRTIRALISAVMVLLGIFLTISLTSSATSEYVRSAASHYYRMRMIVGPVVDDVRLKTFDSRLAQIAGRADFVSLINEMETVARAHGARVPQFQPW